MRIHPNTTCQICGRPIHAPGGLIARHGHKRPYTGGDTTPCFGVNHPPYEKDCNALPKAIAVTEDAIKTAPVAEAKILGGELEFMRKRLANWKERQ